MKTMTSKGPAGQEVEEAEKEDAQTSSFGHIVTVLISHSVNRIYK